MSANFASATTDYAAIIDAVSKAEAENMATGASKRYEIFFDRVKNKRLFVFGA